MSRVSLSFPLVALLLAGCVIGPPPAAAPEPNTECDAAAAQGYVGQPASNQNIEGARIVAGAEAVRTIRPGQAVTLEYSAGRLNLQLDNEGAIMAVTCG